MVNMKHEVCFLSFGERSADDSKEAVNTSAPSEILDSEGKTKNIFLFPFDGRKLKLCLNQIVPGHYTPSLSFSGSRTPINFLVCTNLLVNMY